jgi:predicted transcriptional regulator
MYQKGRRSIILTLFGSNPKTRVLDLFMDNPLFEFTRNEIMESLGMAKITLYKTLPDLVSCGVIVETRKIGKASLFRLNKDSEIVKNLECGVRSYARTLADRENRENSIAGFVVSNEVKTVKPMAASSIEDSE